MNDKPIFDYNDAERRFDRQSNVMISVSFIIVIVAIAAFVIFYVPSAHCQTIGDAQIGIQEIEFQFHNSYKTDTVVVVGQTVRLRFESPNLYDAPERRVINIVREWPGVEHVIFEAHDEIGSLFGRDAGDAIEIKLYPGYNQIIRLQYGGVLSRRYFIVALRNVPNLDVTENGHVTEGDGIFLGLSLGSQWPQRNYNRLCDFNSDGRIDGIDMVIFEQGKYWR